MTSINNQTSYAVKAVPMISSDGRNVVVVVAKGTYAVTPTGGCVLAAQQEPVSFVDQMDKGDPNADVVVPSDLVEFKPATDIVAIKSPGLPNKNSWVPRKIGFEVGSLKKAVLVQKKWPFGPLRRDDKSRLHYAGTYDDNWQKNRMPLCPVDFNARYNQMAPPDQVTTKHLKGDEFVRTSNLFGAGEITFSLPGKSVVVAGNVRKKYFAQVAALDTMLFWHGLQKITLVWRYVIRCDRKIEEVRNVHVYLVRRLTARQLFGV
jgi:hypothetical protein